MYSRVFLVQVISFRYSPDASGLPFSSKGTMPGASRDRGRQDSQSWTRRGLEGDAERISWHCFAGTVKVKHAPGDACGRGPTLFPLFEVFTPASRFSHLMERDEGHSMISGWHWCPEHQGATQSRPYFERGQSPAK